MTSSTPTTTEVWRQPIERRRRGHDAGRHAGRHHRPGGTATTLQGLTGSLDVGAKTGTAQLGTEAPANHAWMIAWAGPPGGEAEIAVAVLVEGLPGQGTEATGNSEAGPVAACMIATYLEVDGIC